MSKLNTSKTTWDLSPLLASDNDPKIQEYRAAITKAAEAFAQKWRDRTDYLEDPAVLKEVLDEMEAFSRAPGNGNEGFYLALRTAQDSMSPDLKAKENQFTEFGTNIHNQLQFFWLNMAKIKTELQPKFLAAPELAPYRHLLERSFISARYQLSEPEEKIMALKSPVAHSNWVKMTDNFLSKEEVGVIKDDGSKAAATEEEMLSLIQSQKKVVRDSSGKALAGLFAKYAEIAEVEANSILGNKKIDDELRGYERPDSARHLSDDIDTEVVDALVGAVSEANDIAQKFYRLKTKLLGLPALEYYERNIVYGNITKQYSYEEACQLVHEVFTDLDPQFGELFSGFLDEGRIDVYPKKGKRGGAFCAYHGIANPTYVMLNFTHTLRDVTTLAHELGHGINDELMKASQNALNFSTSLATAEVASTFMEDFVIEQLANGADDDTKLAIMVSQLGDCIQTIFRQVACYRFEQEWHQQYREKGYLTHKQIGAIFHKHMQAYMGDVAKGCEGWWVSWPHIRDFFYVYSYASGLLISKALQAKVRKDKKFIGKVKQFLAAGTSKSPKDIFAEMGIDITDKQFWNDGLDEIVRLYDETEALAKKLGKI